jgi:hypothetical protein
MYNGSETTEHIHAYHQELGRQIDRVAREIEVKRLLAPTNTDTGADLSKLRPSGIVAAIADLFRPRRLRQQPGD